MDSSSVNPGKRRHEERKGGDSDSSSPNASTSASVEESKRGKKEKREKKRSKSKSKRHAEASAGGFNPLLQLLATRLSSSSREFTLSNLP